MLLVQDARMGMLLQHVAAQKRGCCALLCLPGRTWGKTWGETGALSPSPQSRHGAPALCGCARVTWLTVQLVLCNKMQRLKHTDCSRVSFCTSTYQPRCSKSGQVQNCQLTSEGLKTYISNPQEIVHSREAHTSGILMSVMKSILAWRCLASGPWAASDALGTLGAAGSVMGSLGSAFWHLISMHSAAQALGCMFVSCASLAAWLALSTCRRMRKIAYAKKEDGWDHRTEVQLTHRRQVTGELRTSVHRAAEQFSTSAPCRARPATWPHKACVRREQRHPACRDSMDPVSVLCIAKVRLSIPVTSTSLTSSARSS